MSEKTKLLFITDLDPVSGPVFFVFSAPVVTSLMAHGGETELPGAIHLMAGPKEVSPRDAGMGWGEGSRSVLQVPEDFWLPCNGRVGPANHCWSKHMPERWLQIKGDPSVRAFLFQQQRVESLCDSSIDRLHEIVRALLTHKGVFHTKVHYSSSQLTCCLRAIRSATKSSFAKRCSRIGS